MGLSVLHEFECAIPDDPLEAAAGKVMQQAHWGAEHVLETDGAGVVGAPAAGTVVVLTAEQLNALLCVAFGWASVVTASDKTTVTLANGKVTILEFNTPE